ncbi:putative thiamine pyrophosphokinase [Triangularia verruculosa]|uniref:Thiamine pyrophosphokinase n=1 Tax=Triangularia verruculosa TaxID=2587418 RepID=A0AAN6XLX6_9PEZI|nr:putative thiamine pyrophosphokinase [Triangularia verruculosa]
MYAMSLLKTRARLAEDAPYANLDLVNMVDTWPHPSSPSYANHTAKYYTFFVDPYPKPFGYIHKDFVRDLPWRTEYWLLDHGAKTITLAIPADRPNTFETRTKAMRQTLWDGHRQVAAENKRVGTITRRSLYRWCNELFPLLYPPTREPVLELDGCGVDMLGIINESVFLVAYTYGLPAAATISSPSASSLSTLERVTSSTSVTSTASTVGTSTATTPLSEIDMSKLNFNSRLTTTTTNLAVTDPTTVPCAGATEHDTGELRVYLSRRAAWKSAWPSLLDCSAAGGLSSSDASALEGVIREAHEEVRLPSRYLRSNAKYIGESRLQLCETELGEEGCQMQVQHCFEVELPDYIAPRPADGDGEVTGWVLVTVGELKEKLRMGEIKPASGLVLIRWMLERGLLTEEEGGWGEVGRRLRREFVVQ